MTVQQLLKNPVFTLIFLNSTDLDEKVTQTHVSNKDSSYTTLIPSFISVTQFVYAKRIKNPNVVTFFVTPVTLTYKQGHSHSYGQKGLVIYYTGTKFHNCSTDSL